MLWGYGVGLNVLRLIKKFWDTAVLVFCTDGNYCRPFKAYPGVTQGGPLFPKLFNILVDAVMREAIQQLDGEWDEVPGLRWAVETLLALFYADDALVGSRHPALLQAALETYCRSSSNAWACSQTQRRRKQ